MKNSWKTILVMIFSIAIAWPLTADQGDLEEPNQNEVTSPTSLGGTPSPDAGSWDLASHAAACPGDSICAEWLTDIPGGRGAGDLCCMSLWDIPSDAYYSCSFFIRGGPRDPAGGGGDGTGGDGLEDIDIFGPDMI